MWRVTIERGWNGGGWAGGKAMGGIERWGVGVSEQGKLEDK